jgi:RNA polymerase sigma-70 factor, ECF subfamily
LDFEIAAAKDKHAKLYFRLSIDIRHVQQSESNLLNAIQQGNENAFEMIFREHYEQLCRYAHSFLGDKDEAEEVVQASFIGVWEKRTALNITESIKAYLFQMVRNRCLNVLKHEKVKQLHINHESHHAEKTSESVSENIHARELEQRIIEAIKQLPEQCRLVFNLSRFEEMRYQEIADQLNISVKTVENQMGKALKMMRTQLQEFLPTLLLILNILLR